jgi:hypothetical protein
MGSLAQLGVLHPAIKSHVAEEASDSGGSLELTSLLKNENFGVANPVQLIRLGAHAHAKGVATGSSVLDLAHSCIKTIIVKFNSFSY